MVRDLAGDLILRVKWPMRTERVFGVHVLMSVVGSYYAITRLTLNVKLVRLSGALGCFLGKIKLTGVRKKWLREK